LPEPCTENYATVDWRGVADIGNVLRHAYDQIVDDEIWQTITVDLAPLKTAVAGMLVDIDRADDN